MLKCRTRWHFSTLSMMASSSILIPLLAKGTVEERILEMQHRKRDLAAALLNDSPEMTAAFTADDIEFLFREFK